MLFSLPNPPILAEVCVLKPYHGGHLLFIHHLLTDSTENQRQQAEERAGKMKNVLMKTKKELAQSKREVQLSTS